MPNIGDAEIGGLEEGVIAQMASAGGSATASNMCGAIANFISRSTMPPVGSALAIIENLWLQISPYFHLLHASGNYLKANKQHELMLAALRARDGAAVSLALRDDIDAAYRVLASLLSAETAQ